MAGGIGLCPTRSLILYILDRRSEFKKFTLFFGVKTPQEQLFLEDLANWRRSTDVAYYETVDRADANWKGNVGVITTLFKKVSVDPGARVIICGPPVMYKFVRLDVQDFLRAVQRPGVEVGVVLARQADQDADRVLRELGEFLSRQLGAGRASGQQGAEERCRQRFRE